jgi:hypothetical protein
MRIFVLIWGKGYVFYLVSSICFVGVYVVAFSPCLGSWKYVFCVIYKCKILELSNNIIWNCFLFSGKVLCVLCGGCETDVRMSGVYVFYSVHKVMTMSWNMLEEVTNILYPYFLLWWWNKIKIFHTNSMVLKCNIYGHPFLFKMFEPFIRRLLRYYRQKLMQHIVGLCICFPILKENLTQILYSVTDPHTEFDKSTHSITKPVIETKQNIPSA